MHASIYSSDNATCSRSVCYIYLNMLIRCDDSDEHRCQNYTWSHIFDDCNIVHYCSGFLLHGGAQPRTHKFDKLQEIERTELTNQRRGDLR